MAGIAILAAILGLFGISSQLSSLAAALATILLVSLTAQYAEQTQKLVEENKKDRELRRNERQEDRNRELDSLRRALREEIGKVQYFDDLREDYRPSQSVVGIASPSTIYESNASKIGLLTDDEIDNIVEYYTRLERVSKFMDAQRKVDTSFEKGTMDKFSTVIGRLPDALLHKFTLGRIGARPWEERTEDIQERFEKLSRAQKRALEAIEDNLVDGQDE